MNGMSVRGGRVRWAAMVSAVAGLGAWWIPSGPAADRDGGSAEPGAAEAAAPRPAGGPPSRGPSAKGAGAVDPRAERYRSPHSAAVTPDGASVLVACSTADLLSVVDTRTLRVVAEIPVGRAPHGVAVSPDGGTAYVTHHDADTVGVVDLRKRAMTAEVRVGRRPEGVLAAPTGGRVYVANAGDLHVTVLAGEPLREIGRIPTDPCPARLALSPDGKRLVVACDGEVAERRHVTVAELRGDGLVSTSILTMASNVRGIAVSPDGTFALAAHLKAKIRLPANDPAGGGVVTNAISWVPMPPAHSDAVGTGQGRIDERGAMLAPDEFVRFRKAEDDAAANARAGRPPAPPPTSSSTSSSSSTTATPEPKPRTVIRARPSVIAGVSAPLDHPTGRADAPDFFADPHDVLFSADGRHAFVTSAGSAMVAVVDVARLRARLREPARKVHTLGGPNHLDVKGQSAWPRNDKPPSDLDIPGAGGRSLPFIGGWSGLPSVVAPANVYTGSDDLTESARYVARRIPLPSGARYGALSPDGRTLWVACAMDDSLAAVDVQKGTVRRIALGRKLPDLARRGEQIFNDARFCARRAFTCASCHPGGGQDQLVWNLSAERTGGEFLATKSLLGCGPNAPYGWHGERETLEQRVSDTFRLTMLAGLSREELDAVTAFLRNSKPPAPAPAPEGDKDHYWRVKHGASLFRGKAGCAGCHAGANHTTDGLRDVGTGGKFKVPSLLGVSGTAPYLHDHRAGSLEQIWDVHNQQKAHGKAHLLTETERADLLVYVRSL